MENLGTENPSHFYGHIGSRGGTWAHWTILLFLYCAVYYYTTRGGEERREVRSPGEYWFASVCFSAILIGWNACNCYTHSERNSIWLGAACMVFFSLAWACELGPYSLWAPIVCFLHQLWLCIYFLLSLTLPAFFWHFYCALSPRRPALLPTPMFAKRQTLVNYFIFLDSNQMIKGLFGAKSPHTHTHTSHAMNWGGGKHFLHFLSNVFL